MQYNKKEKIIVISIFIISALPQQQMKSKWVPSVILQIWSWKN